MTALELHRQHPSLDFAPILRVIKYMGFDSNSLSADQVERILTLYPHFERDPELVVGIEAVCRLTDLDADSLTHVLSKHRHEIPFLGTTAHPMVPTAAIDMIRAVANGEDPLQSSQQKLYTLTEMAQRTDISVASLSKYVKEHSDRVPSRVVGRMRKFPREAVVVFQQIKAENLGRRGNGHDRAERQKAAVSRRYAAKLAELETQVGAAVEASKDLSRTLQRLSRQVRRARSTAENGSKVATTAPPSRSRRTGGHRPDTIVAACKKVLGEADGPMRVADITERVIAMGTPIKAKNPNVTVSSILSSYDDFGRVRRGYYELLNPGTRSAQPPKSTDVEAAGPPPSAPATAVASTIERDPEDILAGLQAAADSAEQGDQSADTGSPGRQDEAGESRDQAEGLSSVGFEPFGAAN